MAKRDTGGVRVLRGKELHDEHDRALDRASSALRDRVAGNVSRILANATQSFKPSPRRRLG